MSLLVLACGNPLREDDGVGWRLAEALDLPDLDIRQVQQLGPELAEDVCLADGVLVLDASEGGTPGQIRLDSIGNDATIARTALSHAFSPEALLLCAARLYGRVPPALRLTVAGERFGHGEGLSTEVERALPYAVRQLREVLTGWAGEATGPR